MADLISLPAYESDADDDLHLDGLHQEIADLTAAASSKDDRIADLKAAVSRKGDKIAQLQTSLEKASSSRKLYGNFYNTFKPTIEAIHSLMKSSLNSPDMSLEGCAKRAPVWLAEQSMSKNDDQDIEALKRQVESLVVENQALNYTIIPALTMNWLDLVEDSIFMKELREKGEGGFENASTSIFTNIVPPEIVSKFEHITNKPIALDVMQDSLASVKVVDSFMLTHHIYTDHVMTNEFGDFMFHFEHRMRITRRQRAALQRGRPLSMDDEQTALLDKNLSAYVSAMLRMMPSWTGNSVVHYHILDIGDYFHFDAPKPTPPPTLTPTLPPTDHSSPAGKTTQGVGRLDEVEAIVADIAKKDNVAQEWKPEQRKRKKRPSEGSTASPSPKIPKLETRPPNPKRDPARATKGADGNPLRGWGGDIDFTTKVTALQDMPGLGKNTNLPSFIKKTPEMTLYKIEQKGGAWICLRDRAPYSGQIVLNAWDREDCGGCGALRWKGMALMTSVHLKRKPGLDNFIIYDVPESWQLKRGERSRQGATQTKTKITDIEARNDWTPASSSKPAERPYGLHDGLVNINDIKDSTPELEDDNDYENFLEIKQERNQSPPALPGESQSLWDGPDLDEDLYRPSAEEIDEAIKAVKAHMNKRSLFHVLDRQLPAIKERHPRAYEGIYELSRLGKAALAVREVWPDSYWRNWLYNLAEHDEKYVLPLTFGIFPIAGFPAERRSRFKDSTVLLAEDAKSKSLADAASKSRKQPRSRRPRLDGKIEC